MNTPSRHAILAAKDISSSLDWDSNAQIIQTAIDAAAAELRAEKVRLDIANGDLETTVEELKAQLAEARATKDMHKERQQIEIGRAIELEARLAMKDEALRTLEARDQVMLGVRNDLQAKVTALEADLAYRKEHMEQSDRELLQLEDWLIGNAEFANEGAVAELEARLAQAVRDRSAALMALKTASRGSLFASDELAFLIGLLQREIGYVGLDKESGRRAELLLEKLKALHLASSAVGRTDGLA